MFARLWRRWCDYWFAPGGRIALAVIRIGVAVSMLVTLWRITGWQQPSPFYHHGIWMLYPGTPTPGVVAVITYVAWASTLAMLVGLWSRASHAVSAVTTLAMATFTVAGGVTWSHTDVPQMLAMLALLGARSGDALSIDAWWRARRGQPRGPDDYQWSARLVQLSIGVIFPLAAFEKLRAGGRGLSWALSDSLRHHLLAWYDAASQPRTAVADWLIGGAAWHYELGACANLVFQSSSLLALIFIRRPWIRALAGVMWCSEVLGLGLVMNLWNLHWLPLAVAFIDWDALAARFAKPEVAAPVRSVGRLAFVTGFVVFFAVQALWLNQRLRVFPFSGFPLFAAVRAKKPYDRHQSYEFVGARLEAIGGDRDPVRPFWLAQHAAYRASSLERRPSTIARSLAKVVESAQTVWPDAGITGMRQWVSVFQAPAYPAPAHVERFDLAVLGELDHGHFRSALGTLLPDGKTWIAPPGAPPFADMSLFVVRDDSPALISITATATAVGFVLDAPLTGDPAYLIGRAVDGRPWLLAFRARRGY
jgi:hypothetical protein